MLTFTDAAKRLMETLRRDSRVAAYLLASRGYTTTKEANYIDVRDGMITYFPTNKTKEGVDPWRIGNRVKAKPGKVARKFLTEAAKERLKDSDFEYFANCIKSGKVIQEAVFELVEGEAIRYWYNSKHYSRTKNIGSLASSCMKYAGAGDFMDIYVNNPNQIKMLILRDTTENTLLGRALVWYTGKNVYLDRIYTSDAARRQFILYAQERGWYVRRYNTYSEPQQWIDTNGQYTQRRVTVRLDWTPKNDAFPFLDTFAYFSEKSKQLCNFRASDWTHHLHGTHGQASARR